MILFFSFPFSFLFGVYLVQGTPSQSTSNTSSVDVFTSVEQLKGLSRLESFLSHLLDEYVNGKYHIDALQVVKDFSSEMKKIQKAKELVGIDSFIGHPSNTFLLVRRFIKHWTELSNYLNKGSENELQKILKENKPSFPSSRDLLGCATALLRIQDIYQFPAKQIAKGHLNTNDQGPKLGADECFDLGYAAHTWKYFDLARDWLKETLLRMSQEYGYKGVLKRTRVLEYLAWAEYQTGNLPEAIKHTQSILEKKPKHKKGMEALKSYKAQLKYRQTYINNLDARLQANNRENQKDEEIKAYERLCRGKIIQGQPEEKLRCFYKTDDPQLVLKPAKIELVSVEPEIQILLEAITEKEIQEFKKKAKPKLIRVQAMNSSSAGENVYTDYRISRSVWLEDRDAKPVVTLNKRLEAITGLSLDENHSELLQVVNYGSGGHDEPHHDYLQVANNSSFTAKQRNRMATILLYMSDVSAGGATVFIEAEVIVNPRKGSAVFWYNLSKSGQLDKRTTHGSCPVIIGSKWVANKWVLENGQGVTRPCGLEQDE
ncbi:prolyl 4-hydroxylase subunit alpha-2-like [Actinia tenebrosa]|uniref:procollagen-proline 4-dioxygenase n=1 Tax=Actinia tenebrosa TaxID=6105 RepID=A0A6P8HD16_ACTTE|nr:prolyl 4-hydroxylase subunit alpha-2-like [Actinia tenebrosa]